MRDFFYSKQLGIRLVGLLGLWAVCRMGFYLCNMASFPIENSSDLTKIFFYGIRFDLASIIYVNLLFAVFSLLPFSFRKNKTYQKIQQYIFIIFNGLALYFEVVDMGYFRFAFRRFIGSDFMLVGETTHLFLQFIQDFWYLALLYLALIWILFFLYKKTNSIAPSENLTRWKQIGIFVSAIPLLLIGARGGFQARPIMALTAAQYVEDTRLMPLQSNTTLNILFSAQQRFVKEQHFFPKEKVHEYFSIEKKPKPNAPFKKENVFIIVLESFGKGVIGHYNEYQNSPTPFLDSLIQQSWNFENAYAAGFRSTTGIAAITASIPGLMEDPIMFSAYQGNQIDGLPNVLKGKGYTNAFFHGSNPGSMEFERFSKILGYQEFYDRTRYPDQSDYDGNWGIWDNPFFQFAAKEVDKYNKPFTALLFSLTSHHPYVVEEWFEKKYPDEKPILRAVRYTDFALQEFFKKVKKMDWFDNTLFVITADHKGRGGSKKYGTSSGRYQIPLLFYKPNSIAPRQDSRVIQQIDIMPTVLDYLNDDVPFHSFGTSALDTVSTRYAYTHWNGIYQIIDENFSYTTDLEDPIGLYQYPIDSLFSYDYKGELLEEMEILDEKLKAVIQVHHEAMINNRLSN